ncbi:MAG: histidinol-phosphate transaminase [Pseudomonadota bacterium]
MGIKTTRRAVLVGAAGVAAGAACQPRLTATQAESVGAFPTLPGGGALFGPQPGEVRLHSNENPYGPAESALKLMDYAARKGAYYADDASKTLAKMIADQHGLTPEHIVISAGSAEALSAIAVVWGQRGPIVAPRLFFDATPMYASRLGLATVTRAPMRDDFGVDFPALEAMVTDKTGMVQLCNPNNPTGLLEDAAVLKASVKRMAAKATVVVDEAYMELTDNPTDNSCIDLVRDGHDVIVSRTFSKLYGLAGIRVGYVIAPPEHARMIAGAAMSWMSGVSYAAAIGCYDDDAFINRSRKKILEAREMVTDTLDALDMPMIKSDTNFVFFRSGKPANAVREALARQNIMIRGQYMDYADWSRVSMGLLPDVAKFCRALPGAVSAA